MDKNQQHPIADGSESERISVIRVIAKQYVALVKIGAGRIEASGETNGVAWEKVVKANTFKQAESLVAKLLRKPASVEKAQADTKVRQDTARRRREDEAEWKRQLRREEWW